MESWRFWELSPLPVWASLLESMPPLCDDWTVGEPEQREVMEVAERRGGRVDIYVEGELSQVWRGYSQELVLGRRGALVGKDGQAREV